MEGHQGRENFSVFVDHPTNDQPTMTSVEVCYRRCKKNHEKKKKLHFIIKNLKIL